MGGVAGYAIVFGIERWGILLKKLSIILTTILGVILPSLSWAACRYADGATAPEPGLSQKALESKDWGPKLVELFNNLSKGDKSIVAAILRKPGAALMTTKCSNNDLFWTHLSLVGMSEVVPDAVPAAAADFARAFKLTARGSRDLPGLLRLDGIRR